MKSQDDIQNLYDHLGGGIESYQSLADRHAVKKIYSKWPVLKKSSLQLQSQGLHEIDDTRRRSAYTDSTS